MGVAALGGVCRQSLRHQKTVIPSRSHRFFVAHRNVDTPDQGQPSADSAGRRLLVVYDVVHDG